MGLFGGCSRMVGSKKTLPKICHTYPTMMKVGTIIPYQKKIQKYMNHVTHPFGSADISKFSPENSNTELATQNWNFGSSSLYQSNCIHRSNEQVKQAACFYFQEMSWLPAEHKGQVLRTAGHVAYSRTAGRVLAKSNKLVFFSFDMVPKHIYLRKCATQTSFKPHEIGTMFSNG